MSLSELIAGVAADERTLTVFNPRGDAVERLAEHFQDRNISVRAATASEGPSNFAVLGTGEKFHTAVDVSDVLKDQDDVEPGFERESYVPILDHLDETLFRSYDRKQMLNATREIEDRAWRVGAGELHAGFQTGDNLRKQLDSYRQLGSRDDLYVHAYIYPTEPVPSVEQFQLHLARTEEIRHSWFVVYDGNGVDDYKCALVAEENPLGSGFSGFWTYDPSTVDFIVSHLTSSYSIIESDGFGGDATGDTHVRAPPR
ncbi:MULTISPECIES: DICT sensory domain-containing protein [Haloferax]|uniref:Histidine kinase n=1 Tax=Haloferax marinum TaxID=2666143 RepID=A0A6A8GA15_9EURY|nr:MULTISPECIES: DICT sensory domain-containing protein [Haloferax]KAB1191172.1 histidine kinase [Haloferax sp. CBA1150]MRW98060.1 histidine kinase [Haloferax marinum]